ncbi:MAG: HEAT repeat domain-containing protein, partial [Cyanobacteria bacterium J06642_11]
FAPDTETEIGADGSPMATATEVDAATPAADDDSFTTPIPDPWTEASGQVPEPDVAEPEGAAEPEAPEPEAPEPEATEIAPEPPRTAAPEAAPQTVIPQIITKPQPAADSPINQVTELGKAAAINQKQAIQAVPQLGKLTKDTNADVRLAAITALQAAGSIKAIPFFRQALRDTDNRVVAAATEGLNRFKGAKKTVKKVNKKTKKPRR